MKLIRLVGSIRTPRERMEDARVLCAMVAGAFFETVGIAVVIPLVAVLKDPELLLATQAFRRLVSKLKTSERCEIISTARALASFATAA